VSIGVKAGARLTDDLSSSLYGASESKRYIVGPMVEFGLLHGLSLEVDALYQRQGYQATISGPMDADYLSTDRGRANAWEVPVVLKYKLPIRLLQPCVEAGVAPRLMSGASLDSNYSYNDLPTGTRIYGQVHGATEWSNSVGTVLGVGVQFDFHSLRLTPEVRYTRWNNTPSTTDGAYLHWTQNQVDLLLGISWKVR
jgi:hypothetical protein